VRNRGRAKESIYSQRAVGENATFLSHGRQREKRQDNPIGVKKTTGSGTGPARWLLGGNRLSFPKRTSDSILRKGYERTLDKKGCKTASWGRLTWGGPGNSGKVRGEET